VESGYNGSNGESKPVWGRCGRLTEMETWCEDPIKGEDLK
jgi:hypothetical protein